MLLNQTALGQSEWTFHLNDLRFDAGSGLRVETPFGLVRIDGRPQRRAWRINIGLGEEF